MSPVRERSRYFQRGLISQEHGVAQSLALPKIPAKLTLAFLPRLRPALNRRAFSFSPSSARQNPPSCSHLAEPQCSSNRLLSCVIRPFRSRIRLGHLNGSQFFLQRDDQLRRPRVRSTLLPIRAIPSVSPCPQVHAHCILRPSRGSG